MSLTTDSRWHQSFSRQFSNLEARTIGLAGYVCFGDHHSPLSTLHFPQSTLQFSSAILSPVRFKSARIGATSMIGYQRWWGHVVPTGYQTASNYGLFYFDHIVCPLHFIHFPLHFPLSTSHSPLYTPTLHSPLYTFHFPLHFPLFTLHNPLSIFHSHFPLSTLHYYTTFGFFKVYIVAR
jgi:hypothetical protein